jgi:tetratricopeptide (TPR) repeat protein
MALNEEGPDGLDREDVSREFGAQFPHCSEPALVQAARAGVLPAPVRDRLNEHVAHCAACASLGSDLSTLDEAQIGASGQERIWGRIRCGIAAEEIGAPAKAPRAVWWKFLLRPMPLSMAVAALLVVVGVRFVVQPQPPAAVVSQTRQPEAPTPPPAGVLRLEKPPVMLPAAAVLLWRGASDAGNAPRQELRDALVPYEADRYAEAAEGLEGLAKKYPALAEAHFYLGVCRLFLDRNADAVTSLTAAHRLARPPLADDAAWYLALAYHRGGRDGDARPLLEKLCTATGKNAAKACAGIRELPVVQ